MTDSRWLNELTKTYVQESVGHPANLNEQRIQEQEEYIQLLESVISDIVENYNIDLDAILAEAHVGKSGFPTQDERTFADRIRQGETTDARGETTGAEKRARTALDKWAQRKAEKNKKPKSK